MNEDNDYCELVYKLPSMEEIEKCPRWKEKIDLAHKIMCESWDKVKIDVRFKDKE
jgi:hypothetical protein